MLSKYTVRSSLASHKGLSHGGCGCSAQELGLAAILQETIEVFSTSISAVQSSAYQNLLMKPDMHERMPHHRSYCILSARHHRELGIHHVQDINPNSLGAIEMTKAARASALLRE